MVESAKWWTWRRGWMLAGFCAAFFVGDLFLTVFAASRESTGFLWGVAGFGLAQILWSAGQWREARPDGRMVLGLAVPLSLFVFARLQPPVLPVAAQLAVGVYAMLTALSFATALATRRAFYICGIGLLLFSDMMIGGSFLHAPGCNSLIRDTYLAAMAAVLVSFFWRGEWRIPPLRADIRYLALAGGALAFGCFIVAARLYPGGGYNPLRQVLSALGRTEVRGVSYPACHWWFMAGMFLSALTVAGVCAHFARDAGGWRRYAFGWGGALNAAGLCAIALVPENVKVHIHNLGCNLAVAGGSAVLAAALRRRRADIAWACWLAAVVVFFTVCLNVDAIPFDPWATSTQKALIVSFAVWLGWLPWSRRVKA